MKTTRMMWLVILMALIFLPAVRATETDPNATDPNVVATDPNVADTNTVVADTNDFWSDVTTVGWFVQSADSDVTELRIGIEKDNLSVYVAPRYDTNLADDKDIATDIRFYGFLNAITTEAATKLWGSDELTLPDGDLYAGLFAGFEFTDGQMEAGWALGGRVELLADTNYTLETIVEYQRLFRSWRKEEDVEDVYYGVRACLKF